MSRRKKTRLELAKAIVDKELKLLATPGSTLKPAESVRLLEVVERLAALEHESKDDSPGVDVGSLSQEEFDILRNGAPSGYREPTIKERVDRGDGLRGILIFWLAKELGVSTVESMKMLEEAFGIVRVQASNAS